MIDPYRVLGVQPGVSATALKQAWLRKVRQVHPDTGGDPARFKEVIAAYEMLSRQAAASPPSADRPGEPHASRHRRAATQRVSGRTSSAGAVRYRRGVQATDRAVTGLRTSVLVAANMTDAGLKRQKGLVRLLKLGLSGTEVTDAGLEHLENLTNLQSLSLGRTRVTDAGLRHLKGLTSLRTLGLMMTNVTNSAGVESLQGLTNLQSLNLGGTQVTDSCLQHLRLLTRLQSLNLMWTKVTDAGLEHLEALTRLRRLGLSGTKVTDKGVRKLQAALPKCMIKR